MGVIGVDGVGVGGSASEAGVAAAPAVLFLAGFYTNVRKTLSIALSRYQLTLRVSLGSFLPFGFGLEDCEGVGGCVGCWEGEDGCVLP